METQLNENEKKQSEVIADSPWQKRIQLEAKLKCVLGRKSKVFVGYKRFPDNIIFYANVETKFLSSEQLEKLQHDWTFYLPFYRTLSARGGKIFFSLKYKGE